MTGSQLWDKQHTGAAFQLLASVPLSLRDRKGKVAPESTLNSSLPRGGQCSPGIHHTGDCLKSYPASKIDTRAGFLLGLQARGSPAVTQRICRRGTQQIREDERAEQQFGV